MNQSFLNPEEVLDQLDLRPDMTAAEFGCGSGGFSIPLAKRLEDGLVYAIDILGEPLSALKSQARLDNVVNIRIIRSDLEKARGSTLSDFSIDLVVIPNVLFQIKNKSAMISEAARVLKKNGKLAVIDWLAGVSQGPEKGRISAEEVKKLAEAAELKLEKDFPAGKYHFGLIFEKI